ncbi:hypothetical protein M885DRAFT_556908 [Pelagophyceae sp. CCMP2097]|nr:hypothetical protein M885DRAFT_556908 [Pelagophyceae sp. CCMP2097]
MSHASRLQESQQTFGTDDGHLAYSSFSHIGEVQNLSFAVGLRAPRREDDETAALYVQRILPMCKIVPGKPLERRRNSIPAEATPAVPEIVEMRARLRELHRSNDKMESECDAVDQQYKDVSDKLESVEKRSRQIDEQLDQLNDQLAEERNRSRMAGLDSEQVKQAHGDLREQVANSEVVISKLEAELLEKRRQLAQLESCSDLEMVFGLRKHEPNKQDLVDAVAVASLDADLHKNTALRVRTGAQEDYKRRMETYKKTIHRAKPGPKMR